MKKLNISIIFVFISLLLTSCEKPYYQPNRVLYQTPAKHGLKYEDIKFKSKDGTQLTGWFIPATQKAKGTVIHFHGNAQNMTAHFSFVAWLPKNQFNVFTFDYRGYGQSAGTPTRDGVHADCIAALKYIKSRKDIDQDRIIVIGQSLGGANAIAANAEKNWQGIRGIVIESAFSSYRKIARDVVNNSSLGSVSGPITSVMVHDRHSPMDVVHKISPTPILFIHGTADRVIPYKHAVELYNKAKDPKQIWTIKNGRHTQAFSKYAREVLPRLYKVMSEWVK